MYVFDCGQGFVLDLAQRFESFLQEVHAQQVFGRRRGRELADTADLGSQQGILVVPVALPQIDQCIGCRVVVRAGFYCDLLAQIACQQRAQQRV